MQRALRSFFDINWQEFSDPTFPSKECISSNRISQCKRIGRNSGRRLLMRCTRCCQAQFSQKRDRGTLRVYTCPQGGISKGLRVMVKQQNFLWNFCPPCSFLAQSTESLAAASSASTLLSQLSSPLSSFSSSSFPVIRLSPAIFPSQREMPSFSLSSLSLWYEYKATRAEILIVPSSSSRAHVEIDLCIGPCKRRRGPLRWRGKKRERERAHLLALSCNFFFYLYLYLSRPKAQSGPFVEEKGEARALSGISSYQNHARTWQSGTLLKSTKW